MRRTTILIPLLVAALGATAQVREAIEVRLVEVTVTVSDEKGNPIRDLKPSDFEVYDEGRKQAITNFDVIDYSVPVPAAARTPVARRNFLLVFDISNASPASLMRARGTALEFVSKQVQRLDRVAVATLSSQHGLHLLTSFTTDRDIATRAIRTLGVPRFYQPRDPLLISLVVPDPLELTLTEIEAAVREFLEEIQTLSQKVSLDAQRHSIGRELGELTELGRALDHVSGRKHIILFSEGFDPRALQGRSELGSQEARQEQQAGERGQIWRIDTDNVYGNTSTASDLRKMVESMRRSDVVLHAMDIKGLRTDTDASVGYKRTSNDALYLLSHDTGGLLFKNSNELTSDLARFLKSQEVAYTLGYRAQRGAPGKFRRLNVKVPSVPNARVSYRIGYYEPDAAGGTLDRTLLSADILSNRIPVQDVKLTGFAAAVPQKGAPGLVPVVLEIDGEALLRSAEGAGLASAEIFVYAFDNDDRARDLIHQRVSFDMSRIKKEALAAGVKFYGTLRLQQGDYSVRALVRSGGRNGFVEMPVLVPASAEQYAAAPMVMGDMNSGLKVRAPGRPGDEYPFHVGDTTFMPAANAVLKSGEARQMVLFLYNVPIDNLQVKAAVDVGGTSRDAALTLVGRTEREESGAIKLLMNVTPPAATRGEGRLLVTIGGSAGADLQQVSVPVRVE